MLDWTQVITFENDFKFTLLFFLPGKSVVIPVFARVAHQILTVHPDNGLECMFVKHAMLSPDIHVLVPVHANQMYLLKR